MRKGIRWRVGNDKSINVMKDGWLCDLDNPMMTTESDAFLDGLKVCDLINAESRTWNVQLLELLLCERDRERILMINLSKRLCDNSFY